MDRGEIRGPEAVFHFLLNKSYCYTSFSINVVCLQKEGGGAHMWPVFIIVQVKCNPALNSRKHPDSFKAEKHDSVPGGARLVLLNDLGRKIPGSLFALFTHLPSPAPSKVPRVQLGAGKMARAPETLGTHTARGRDRNGNGVPGGDSPPPRSPGQKQDRPRSAPESGHQHARRHRGSLSCCHATETAFAGPPVSIWEPQEQATRAAECRDHAQYLRGVMMKQEA
ncbi:hypothetical protein QTO34_020169, partial [Cnephaeus nilssonii]